MFSERTVELFCVWLDTVSMAALRWLRLFRCSRPSLDPTVPVVRFASGKGGDASSLLKAHLSQASGSEEEVSLKLCLAQVVKNSGGDW